MNLWFSTLIQLAMMTLTFTRLARAVASGEQGGSRPPPPRGTLDPLPRTFSEIITDGQLEHYNNSGVLK